MRYVFIVNPNAGGGKGYDTIYSKAEEYFADRPEDSYKVYQTEYPRHATEIVKEELKSGEHIRFYGVGGDGTLLEVARGCINEPNAEVGVFPVGSGNDYVKTFGTKDQFLSFHRQMEGVSIKVDAIETMNGTALNICSVGLDAKVAINMDKFKVLPGVGGSLAYDLALGKVLASGKLGTQMEITVTTPEGERHYEGNYIFALAANGQWYGGGYHGAPDSIVNDGLMDFILVKMPAITRIPALIGVYKNGKHLHNEKYEDIITFCRGYEMHIKPIKTAICNRDGECDEVSEENFKLLPGAVNFILPKGITYGEKIETERLVLRRWNENDLEDFFDFASDPEVRIIANSKVVSDMDEAERALKTEINNPECYAIVLKESEKAIGYIKYQKDHARGLANCRSIGYELNRSYWGKGYATEALEAMKANAFEEMGLALLSVGHFSGNEGSRRVIEKCGFTYEGVTHQCLMTFDGKIVDAHNYYMTKDHYFANK